MQFKQDYTRIANGLGRTCNEHVAREVAAALSGCSCVVDVGSGSCGEAEWLAQAGFSVTCIDSSFAMLRLASEKRLRRVCADVFSAPVRAGRFDGSYIVNLLQIASCRQILFGRIASLLSPNGRIALIVTRHSDIRTRYVNRFFPSLPRVDCERYPSLGELAAELGGARLVLEYERRVHLGSTEVDESYCRRLATGIFSGLLYLPEGEYRQGMTKLIRFQRWLRSHGKRVRFSRTRSLVLARKIAQ